MRLAERFNGQIISADSRQIYRRLDIGTAKPSTQDRARIPHHLIDVADVTDDFSARDFADLASQALTQIADCGQLPVIVGGSGLYLMALTTGIFDGPAKNVQIRAKLEEMAAASGPQKLHDELAKVDPATAAKIAPADMIRTVRALEVYYLAGAPISRLRAAGRYSVPPAEYIWIGLNHPRNLLYAMIDRRVDRMIALGLLDEIKSLLTWGWGPAIRRKKIVGYFEVIDALDAGSESMTEAIALVKQHSRNYAKRQLTWFRNKAPVQWIEAGLDNVFDKVFSIIDEYLSKRT